MNFYIDNMHIYIYIYIEDMYFEYVDLLLENEGLLINMPISIH